MIVALILQVFLLILITLLSVVPVFSVPAVALSYLTYGVAYFNTATQIFPPLSLVWSYFLYVLLFEIAFMILRFFLAGRSPVQ